MKLGHDSFIVVSNKTRELNVVQVEDMFFQECTPRFLAKKKIRTPLTQTHRVVFVITGPLEQGLPVRRRRLHSAGLAMHDF